MRPLPSWYCIKFRRTCRYSKLNRRLLWIQQRHRVTWSQIRKAKFRWVARASQGKVRDHSRFLLQWCRASILQGPRLKERSKLPRLELLLSLRHPAGSRESISSWTTRWIRLKNNLCPSRIWTPLTAAQPQPDVRPSFQTLKNLSLPWNPSNKWQQPHYSLMVSSTTGHQKILLLFLTLQEDTSNRTNAIRCKKATLSKVRLRSSGAIFCLRPNLLTARNTMAMKLSSTLVAKTTKLQAQLSRRISEPSIRQNYARTGSSPGFVHSRIPAPSHMVLTSSIVKLMFPRTTRQSSANASTRSYTAHMVPDASSSILLSTCSKRVHPSSSRLLVFLHLSSPSRFPKSYKTWMQPSPSLLRTPHKRLRLSRHLMEKHKPKP